MLRIASFFIFTILIFSCTCVPRHPSYPPVQKPRPEVLPAEIEKKLHQLINVEQRMRGLTELVWNNRLAGIARTIVPT